MARPRKQEHEKRTVSLPPIRVTEAERIHVQEKAEAVNMTVSDFLRSLGLSKEVTPRATRLEMSLLVELNRIGVNINQIAKAANLGRDQASVIEASLTELRALMAKVDQSL